MTIDRIRERMERIDEGRRIVNHRFWDCYLLATVLNSYYSTTITVSQGQAVSTLESSISLLSLGISSNPFTNSTTDTVMRYYASHAAGLQTVSALYTLAYLLLLPAVLAPVLCAQGHQKNHHTDWDWSRSTCNDTRSY